MELKEFLIEHKTKLLERERRATGQVKNVMVSQIQVLDVILMFLNTKQTEEDMGKLQLTLEKQAIPVDELKPRQATPELDTAIIELAQKTKMGFAWPLNLPEGTKTKSVTTKIYAMKKRGLLDPDIWPVNRGKVLNLARMKKGPSEE